MVALFTRAWIEIDCLLCCHVLAEVALFTRAWIEILVPISPPVYVLVALFTRAWIEIDCFGRYDLFKKGRPLHEGVD